MKTDAVPVIDLELDTAAPLNQRHSPLAGAHVVDRRRSNGTTAAPRFAARELLPTAPDTRFAILSFEGPDAYSRAGGLGTRVTDLARELAGAGHRTDTFFVGDPNLPAQDLECNGLLTWRRWSQWISRYYPAGVYEGENDKLPDYRASVPRVVMEEIVAPAIEAGQRVVVLAEDWHTVSTLCDLSDLLYVHGMRQHAVLLWNANNSFGFDKVDFGRLRACSTLTAVSRWMKHEMWKVGVDPLVVPNGIQDWWLKEPQSEAVEAIRRSAGDRALLCKIARFDPDKRWLSAIHAAAELKQSGTPVRFIARGGREAHGGEVLHLAHSLGLKVHHAAVAADTDAARIQALHQDPEADMVVFEQNLPRTFLHSLYAASDAVLANSGREPFGLVGLEAMASGGIAITGCTGEEYCVSGKNGIALQTDDPREIALAIRLLRAEPGRAAAIREEARRSAAQWTWSYAIDRLRATVSLAAVLQDAWARAQDRG